MKKTFDIISKKTIWLSISGFLVVTSLVFLAVWGLKPGLDFTGGSLLEVRFTQNALPDTSTLRQHMNSMNLGGEVVVQPTDNDGYIIRYQDISEDTHQKIVTSLREEFPAEDEGQTNLEEVRFESIGPSIGKELRTQTAYAISITLIAIIAYIAWAFRKVSWPIKSWKYGVIAVVALFHDIIITMGLFSFLGHFYNVDVGLPFVAALLTILGYSVNDTIVMFDRIRENIGRLSHSDFLGLVNRSINETLSRSINTTFTTLLALIAIFFWGGVTIKYFALAMICGIFFGSYSSIFVASPLLVIWGKFRQK